MRAFGTTRGRSNDPFLEDYVDRQIDQFLIELQEKMTLIRKHQGEVNQGRKLIQEADAEDLERSARFRFHTALDSLQKRTSDVWNMLRYIFTELEGKGRFKPSLTRQDSENLFLAQSAFMATELGKAEDQITRYFFRSSATVHLSELHGENMLTHLYRVRETAKKVKEAVEP